MNTFELIEELSNKPKEEIKYALLALMLKEKIDFIDLNASYVEYINSIKEDRLNQLIEAEICILESFIDKKEVKKRRILSTNKDVCIFLTNLRDFKWIN